MPKTKTEAYPEIDEIREDLDSLKDNVIELTRHIKQDGLKQATVASSAAKDQYKALKVRGRKEVKNLEKQVKDKPGQSLAIAFASGLVASMILRGRR